MLVTCSECQKEVSSSAKICPHCGYSGIISDFNKAQREECEKSNKWVTSVLSVIAGIVVLYMGTCMIQSKNEFDITMNKCKENGLKHYKDIGSYPYLTTGERAEKAIERKCLNSRIAFGEVSIEE